MQITDLCDSYREKIQVAEPIFHNYGGKRFYSGCINTVKVFEDNALVREMLSEPCDQGILVVDGGGSLRTALLGDQLAKLGHKNGWQGIIVFGCIRDSAAICGIDIGVKALNTHPLKSIKKGEGDRNIPVSFAGLTFTPGHYLYADDDGLIISERALMDA